VNALVYIGQDGAAPSGVSTYGYHVLRQQPEARMLLLNADAVPPAAPTEIIDRIATLPEAASHVPALVAGAIRAIAERTSGPLTILPNSGDTPWAATAEFLRTAPESLRHRVRVLGIVHSDVETQYTLAGQYRTIAPVWIGVSRRCAEELRLRAGGRGAGTHELPYPITPPAAVVRSGDGPLRLAYVGRLEEPQKRVSRLVALFAELSTGGVDFVATVVGDGPAATAFTAGLAAAGPAVAARVRCTGALDRRGIDEIWRTHDVALLVSGFEGLPLALLEAMAAGVCPVAMAIESGLDDLLQDGPQGDVPAMAEVLTALAQDQAAVHRMGTAARARVQERFSPERHFRRLAAIVEEVWRHPAPDGALLAPDPTAVAVREMVTAAAKHKRPLAVYGAGMFGRKVVDACLDEGLPLCAWFDSDPARMGATYRGVVCQAPAAVVERPEAVILAASLQFAPAIAARIAKEFLAAEMPEPTIITPLS